jgi:hypothetical protein
MKTTVQYFNLFVAGFCAAFMVAHFIMGNLILGLFMFGLAFINFMLFLRLEFN